MNTRTIEEILALLERIASALERISPATPESVEAPEKPQNAPEPEKVETPEPAAPAQPEEKPEEKPSVTIDQIRKMVVTLSAMGNEKKAAVRDVILKYGVNVSGIPADKCPEVMEQLTALKEVKA